MTDSSDTSEPKETKLRRVSFTMAPSDIDRLRRITARRHPDDPRSLSLTVRELIREEEARHLRHERNTGK